MAYPYIGMTETFCVRRWTIIEFINCWHWTLAAKWVKLIKNLVLTPRAAPHPTSRPLLSQLLDLFQPGPTSAFSPLRCFQFWYFRRLRLRGILPDITRRFSRNFLLWSFVICRVMSPTFQIVQAILYC